MERKVPDSAGLKHRLSKVANVGLMLDNWCGKASFDVKKDMCKKSEKPVFNARAMDGAQNRAPNQRGRRRKKGTKAALARKSRRRKVGNTRRNESGEGVSVAAHSERNDHRNAKSNTAPHRGSQSFVAQLDSHLLCLLHNLKVG